MGRVRSWAPCRKPDIRQAHWKRTSPRSLKGGKRTFAHMVVSEDGPSICAVWRELMTVLFRSILAVLLLTSAVSCARTEVAPELPSFEQECAVTFQALHAAVSQGRPWTLSRETPRKGDIWRNEQVILQAFPDEQLEEDEWRWFSILPENGFPVRAEGPSVEMAHTFASTRPVNGVTCSEVRDLAASEGAMVAAVEGTRDQSGADDRYQWSHVNIERSVLSPDRREALIYVAQQSGPLAGGGYLIHYRRSSSGEWRETARLGVWIS